MIDRLIHALVESKNAAADDVLLEALRLGQPVEQSLALNALIQRQKTHGLCGIIEVYDSLPQDLQLDILKHIGIFHHAIRECGRSDHAEIRLAAMKLIALSRQGKLAYVLSENLHDLDENLSKVATEAMVALARWISMETRALQKGLYPNSEGPQQSQAATTHHALMENRGEIEAAVARAMDVHRGKHGPELLRACLLLCDWPGSKTLAILNTSKHGGQSPMVRRLQQPPASEHVEAFLLGASHGGLRSHFGIVFSHIEEAPVLDALLRKTHWLKDHQLQLCMHQVNRGTWWGDSELLRDIERRPSEDAVKIGEWIAVSGMHDVMQDQSLDRLREHAKGDFASRLRLLRIAMGRKRGASVQLLRSFLSDPDERIQRMAARDIVRRQPADFENMLLQLMTAAPESVRRVVSRAIGQEGFEHFWDRFDRMDKSTRRQAGRAMLKLMPDAAVRLSRRLATGPVDQRIKAMQVVHELGLVEGMRHAIEPLCSHPHAKVRSKAVMLIGEVSQISSDTILDKVLNDTDPRVRANAIEVLETKRSTEYVPLLAQRARSSHNRERANAIKAMNHLRVSAASTQLMVMLKDGRPEHRISALWALRQIGWWQLLKEVGRIAKEDDNLRVRRYALGVLRGVAEIAHDLKGKTA
ncbi:MAG TPA: HEAT repeat domain-containing protein [Tepidisphaeraceae bacterium]|nr:HEAT repeat domain-containing protein [Tepidisphaeraceae bacterium]